MRLVGFLGEVGPLSGRMWRTTQVNKKAAAPPPMAVPVMAAPPHARGGEPATPKSPGGGTKAKKIDVVGAQTDGAALARALPSAIPIPQEAQHWAQVGRWHTHM